MWLLALVSVALAGPTGYWHPEDLVGHSQRFAEANDALAGEYESVTKRSVALAQALRDYREALDLLGPAAPAEEYARLDALEQQFNRQHAQLQAFADTLIEDFDAEFSAARERAVRALGAVAVECQAQLPDGPQVPGMRPRTKKNPACTGEDLNPALAAHMDADPALAAALKEIGALTWPLVDLPKEPQVPTSGAPRHVAVRALLAKGAQTSLQALERADDEARMTFEAAIEEGADKAALQAQVAAARAITQDTATKRKDLAAPVLAAAEAALSAWAGKGEPATGWCANPAALGGCSGEDATAALTPRLLAEKKVAKTLP